MMVAKLRIGIRQRERKREQYECSRAGSTPAPGNQELILFGSFWLWSHDMESIIYCKESIMNQFPRFRNRPSPNSESSLKTNE